MQEDNQEVVETPENQELDYELLKDANIERFFVIDLQVEDETDFWYDGDDNLLGAVVHFDEYPTRETLVEIFDDLLNRAVQHTQDVDAEEAAEMIDEDCENEEDFPAELDVSESFSLLFTVTGHRGLYRCLLDNNDYWVGHSSGRKGDRFEN